MAQLSIILSKDVANKATDLFLNIEDYMVSLFKSDGTVSVRFKNINDFNEAIDILEINGLKFYTIIGV
jgi:hypothetical protein